ncbi:hypothetical protein HPB52_025622 [Rhipicephalus sanguineus]|uniref:CS domain-containing protein n=1 Tax=Rhipicephalus sanguineus TaxID=34632 RepID=A0A9D4SM57_RHISA|nr:hypothetical protein HPB52_025622 [Rhipicephalus sanguineus]
MEGKRLENKRRKEKELWQGSRHSGWKKAYLEARLESNTGRSERYIGRVFPWIPTKCDPRMTDCQCRSRCRKVEGSPSLPSSDEELKDENPTVELVGPKYDYYESGANGDTVTVTLFVKSISKEALAVDFDERGFLVKFHTKNTNTEFLEQHGASEETTFTWRVNVKEAIRPEDCRYRLSPCKLELVLKKKVPSAVVVARARPSCQENR